MVREVAPNLSYHYWFLGIRGLELEEEADPEVLVRGSEYKHERKIESQDDEGHMGTATTKISTYRSKASADPSYTDVCRYKEGWEDIWLLLLGSAKGTVGHEDDIIVEEVGTSTGVYDYTFKINVDAPKNPYFATLYNGFAKDPDGDTYKYEDCLLSQFELSGSNEEAPKYTATFSSNYPKVNQPNIARTFPAVTVFPKSSDVRIYIAPVGTTDGNMSSFEYPCYIDWSISVNNNITADPCSGDTFGTSTKVLGNREGTFKVTVPWTSATRHLEKVYETGASDGTEVTSENDVKKVWIVMEGTTIGSTSYKYTTTIKIPRVVVTSAYSEQSGTDAKQIELEGDIEESGTASFIETVVRTDLSALHIDNTATTSSP